MKPMPASEMQRAMASGERSIFTPSAARTSAAPVRDDSAVAVLRDRDPGAGDHEGRAGRNVVGSGRIATSADHVDRARGRVDPRHLGTHRRHGAGDLIDGLARTRSAISNPPICDGVDLARHHALEGGCGTLRASAVAPVATWPMSALSSNIKGLCGPHAAPRTGRQAAFHRAAMSRKFFKIEWPCSEAMLSGWNCTPCTG